MKRSNAIDRRRMLQTLGLAAAATVSTGCWGSFALTGKVYDWNGSFGSKWASWGVFLAFIILPVYGTLLFIDALVINTIEFFSGKNPVQRSADLPGGERLVFTPVPGEPHTVEVTHERGEQVARRFKIRKHGRAVTIHDQNGERLRVEEHGKALELTDEAGFVAKIGHTRRQEAEFHLRDGATPTDAVLSTLDLSSLGRTLARADMLQVGMKA